MADIPQSLRTWSATAGNNSPSDSTTIGAGLDDNLRVIQSTVRQFLASQGSNIASAATMDLSTMDGYYASVTGNTTVTGLGTEAAGISYWLEFAGVLTLTHNASSLILPGAANITTAAGDTAYMMSEGSGNWRCLSYTRKGVVPGAFLATTSMVFAQTSAPTGWTKSTTHDDKALRVVTGTASSGGATAFTSVFGSGKTTGSHTLTAGESAALTFTLALTDGAGAASSSRLNATSTTLTGAGATNADDTTVITSNGGGGGHTHTLSMDLQYVDVIIATKD